MPGTTIARGNLLATFVLQVNITPAVVAPNATAEQNFNVQGLVSSDQISAFSYQGGAYTLNVDAVNYRVTTANVLTVAYNNPTSASITPPAGVYFLEVNRAELPAPANAI